MLDLVGTTGNRLRGCRDQHLGDDRVDRVVALLQQAAGSGDHRVHVIGSTGNLRERQLADRAFRAWWQAEFARDFGPLRGELGCPLEAVQLHHLLADDRICVQPRRLGPVDHEIDATHSLRIPLVGLEVFGRFRLRLVDTSADDARLEVHVAL